MGYVVKNCPARAMSIKTMNKCYYTNNSKFCYERDNCIVKEVIEKCKNGVNNDEIIQLFNIQEVD